MLAVRTFCNYTVMPLAWLQRRFASDAKVCLIIKSGLRVLQQQSAHWLQVQKFYVRPVILLPAAVSAQGNLCGLVGVMGSMQHTTLPASVRPAARAGQDLSSSRLNCLPCRQKCTLPTQGTVVAD